MIEGTTYYEITLSDAINAYKDENIVMYAALELYGWDAINVTKYLLGSDIVDDKLYLCVTDGEDIEVDDDWADDGLLDPEDALAAVGVEVISSYVKPADKDTILDHLTLYDLDDDIDLDEIAKFLLDEKYSFADIVEAAADAQLIEV